MLHEDLVPHHLSDEPLVLQDSIIEQSLESDFAQTGKVDHLSVHPLADLAPVPLFEALVPQD